MHAAFGEGSSATGSVEPALDRAAASCARRGAQLTELRRQVLRLVLESESPIGAYALLDRLRAVRAGAAPPTVYRALDFLLEHGLIHKVERLNAFVGCVDPQHDHGHGDAHHDHPTQFLICRRCGTAQELSDPGVMAAIRQAAAAAGFAPSSATVEVEGFCRNCRSAAAA